VPIFQVKALIRGIHQALNFQGAIYGGGKEIFDDFVGVAA
jgi:hypothetical protein